MVSKARVWKESEHLFSELKVVVQRFMDEVPRSSSVFSSREAMIGVVSRCHSWCRSHPSLLRRFAS